MKDYRKHSRAVAAAALALGAMLSLPASPAAAKTSDGWVRGYDTYVGDWGDEGTLSNRGTNPYRSSNATCLWQRILWAEGATHSTGGAFPTSFINGTFTTDTETATKNLQRRWGLTADGLVGPNTFGRADNYLSKRGGSTARGKTLLLRYEGDAHTFSLSRNTDGKYVFPDGDGDSRQAGYNYRTCS